MVESMKKLPRDLLVTSQEEEDQHYYHSLENGITDVEGHVSPEYAASESIKVYCKNLTSQEEEEDQHYYHSLENLIDDNIADGTGNGQKCMAVMNPVVSN